MWRELVFEQRVSKLEIPSKIGWCKWLAPNFFRGCQSASVLACFAFVAFFALASQCPLSVTAQDAKEEIRLAPPIQVPSELSSEVAVQPSWSLDALVAVAVQNSPSLREAQARVEAARGHAVQVGLRENPNVGFDFQQMFSDGQAEQYGITYDQRFVRKQKLALNRAVAGHEIRQLEQRLAAEYQRVTTDVRVGWIRYTRTEFEVAALEDLARLNQQAVNWARELFTADEVARTDVLQAELELQRVQLKLREARIQTKSKRQQLAVLVGQPIEGPIAEGVASFYDLADPIEFDEALRRVLTANPQISERIAGIERARCHLQRQAVESKPDVSVRGLLNVVDNGVGGRPNAGLAVSVPWPIHDRNQGAIYQARQQLIAAEQALEKLERSIAARLAPIHGQYVSAVGTAVSYQQELIPQASKTLELIQQTYKAGEANFNSLLTAQRTVAQLQLEFLDVVERAQISAAQMNGLLLGGILQPAAE